MKYVPDRFFIVMRFITGNYIAHKAVALLLLFFISANLVAQTFLFEQDAVPSEWSPVQGTLTISDRHWKEGTKSLCWTTSGTSVLNVTVPAFTASTGNSAFLQLYTPGQTNDTLVVEFLSQAVVRRTANYLLNYKGWREFNRAYTEYSSNVSFSVTSVRITLKPASAGMRSIYFDEVKFNQPTASVRITGSQWLLDRQFFKTNNDQLNLFANPVDIALQDPTALELADLEALRVKYRTVPTAGTFANLVSAKNFVADMSITRNEDGTVSGAIIPTSAAALTTATVTDYVTRLEILAAEGLKDTATLTIFRNFLDHLLEQGFGEGANFLIKSNDYTASRNIPTRLLNILPACTQNQKTEVLKLARWISYYGMLYESQATYLANLNSDVVYLYLPYMVTIALFQPDEAQAVREMKAVKRFIDRNTDYTPGGNDILKPDGTGFHHGTHYNNYMYSYQTWAETVIDLAGTSFAMNQDAYRRFRKAVIAKYTMATKDLANSRHYSNALAGRNPFASGIQVFFSRTLMEQLIVAGGAILGTGIDAELAAAYNYFFDTPKYDVPAVSYDGFHQFNYSPAAIFRKDNWVATMRAPTTKFWGAEIYSGENRFGRYQSHGALDITYRGTQANSGYPGSSNGGGWDWNVIPGTTTVHYTNWTDMMPNKTTSDRFDQYTKTKNFSGALAWGDCGMFATDFDQIDNWGSQKFVPTNLLFKKTMVAFDDLIISLGSNISSSGTYSTTMITATNLFQNLISSQSKALNVNGNEVTSAYSATLLATQDNWLISPQGTGYFLPKGHDELKVLYGTQKTPYETGTDAASPVTSATAAKAYLNHGVKPTGKSHHFVVVPAATPERMLQLASNPSEVYQVVSQSSTLHAVRYLPTQTTAYSFFAAQFNIPVGIVKSSTAEHLLMHRPDAATGLQYFAASNPNLQPVTDALYGWKASTSQTTLTLGGEWYLLNETAGVKIYPPEAGQTQLTLTFQQGEPVYFTLKPAGYTNINQPDADDWISVSNHRNNLSMQLNDPSIRELYLKVISSDGIAVLQRTLHSTDQQLTLPHLTSGIYFVQLVASNGKTKILKLQQ